ncbi:MAG: aspartate aminotransferase family protein [Dehalococcoidia bacterium]|jgi:glutamate-1-semialdehyde 2,1-aminomutase|tara:strand:- start:7413 stop:8738 length:1326 start_codon:yes stop_codon:yes gene_type:complete
MVKSLQSLEQEYIAKTPVSKAQWQKGQSSMPGGVIKGAYWSSPYPDYVDRAEGCYVWNLDGQKFVDFGNHHSAMLLGHSHPNVIKAIEKELKRGLGLGGPTTLEAEISEEIVNRFPSVDQVRFANSGTEASLHATRMVKTITGRPKIAKFEGAYHGSHDALEVSVATPLDKAGDSASPNSIGGQKGMSSSAEEDVIILPYNDIESVELILRENKDQIAGVFYDSKLGLLDIPHEFTRFVRDITKELEIPMVMDEVVSFRTGYSGAQGLAQIEPDITYFGKAFGGGFPVGAIGGKKEFMQVIDNSGDSTGLNQSGTFSGNNFTLAAGLANLKTLTPLAYKHLNNLGLKLSKGLSDEFNKADIPVQVLHEGSAVAMYITDKKIQDYRSSVIYPDHDLTNRIILGLYLKGYSLRGGIQFTVSMPMDESHIEGFLKALSEVLKES